MIDVQRVDYIRIPVTDMGEANHFYGEVLGLERNPNSPDEDWVEYDVASAVGTGFHPNSSITLFVSITSPPLGSVELPGFATTDANGSWSFEGPLECDFGEGQYVGPFVEDITATDDEGASASSTLTADCVEP